MSEPGRTDIEDASSDASPDLNTRIASLRASGAGRFDSARMHYIDVMAARAATHEGNVRRMLDARLTQALAAFGERFDQARSAAGATVDRAVLQFPQAADDLRRLLAAGDFRGLRRLVSSLEAGERCAMLSALVRDLERQVAGNDGAPPAANTGTRPELKAIRHYRSTWSRLSVEKQISQALEQAPKNAGPINSHMLVLRSLALMRDTSPDYLNRFMSYAETLLSLEIGEEEKPAKPKKRQPTRAAKK